MKKIVFWAVVFAAMAFNVYAGTIAVTLVYEDGSKCAGCTVSNDWNHKNSFTDKNGTASVDVGTADRDVQIYVGGAAAACAKAGESVTVKIKSIGLGGSTYPVNENKCR